MREKLINEVFAEFEKSRADLAGQLKNGMDVVVLQKINENGESFRMILHYDERKEERRKWWDE